MKTFMKIITVIALIAVSNVVQAAGGRDANLRTYEGEPVRLFIGKDLKGFAHLKECEKCEIIKLVITPDTKALMDNKYVSLESQKGTTQKPKMVFYNVKTSKVTRLYWYTM